MRNFKKVMALAVSVAAVCTSVSAFAATTYTVDGLNGTYDAANNALTLTVDGAAGDKTVLVLNKGVVDTAATGEDILYINQYAENETAFTAMGLKGTTALTAGTYAVKVGYEDANGDFAIASGNIIVEEKQDTVEVTFYLGDVDASGVTNGTDANYIFTKLSGGSAKVGDSQVAIGEAIADGFLLGDVDASGATNGTDANYIFTKLLGGAAKVGESTYGIGELVKLQVPAK